MKKLSCVDGHKLTNREKKQQPRKGWSWCYACDRCLVPNNRKCIVCGCHSGGKNFKK